MGIVQPQANFGVCTYNSRDLWSSQGFEVAGTQPHSVPSSAEGASGVGDKRLERGPSRAPEVPTEDFQRSVELAPLSRPREGTVILVLDVAPGSASEAAGIRPGQQLLELSDPLRGGETWELNGLASIKYVRQAVGARARETINVSVTPEPVPEWEEAVAAARGHGNGASGSEVGQELSASEKAEVHSRLQSLQDAAVQQKKAVRQKKLDARNAYYEEGSSTSSKAPFMIGFGLFLGLPLVILAIAYSSGFFDSLGVGRTL
ncbi:hypothetical protein N2152v2_004911 [Parachlorella kessleri]